MKEEVTARYAVDGAKKAPGTWRLTNLAPELATRLPHRASSPTRWGVPSVTRAPIRALPPRRRPSKGTGDVRIRPMIPPTLWPT